MEKFLKKLKNIFKTGRSRNKKLLNEINSNLVKIVNINKSNNNNIVNRLNSIEKNIKNIKNLQNSSSNNKSSTTIDKKSIYHDLDILADHALEKLIKDYQFKSVLDIGCGEGVHSDIFLENKKDVTAVDYGNSPYFKKNKNRIGTIIGDFNEYKFTEQYDCVWCSHLLEHQLNPNMFLIKVNSVLKEGGVLAITVPSIERENKNCYTVVGGHVTCWYAGILLYQLVLAGFDCSEASVKKYRYSRGYNVSVIVKKRKINVLDKLVFDNGDIKTIQKYLPKSIEFKPNQSDIKFNGNIEELNW